MKSPKHDLKLLTMGMFGFDCIGDKKHSKDSWKDNKTINVIFRRLLQECTQQTQTIKQDVQS